MTHNEFTGIAALLGILPDKHGKYIYKDSGLITRYFKIRKRQSTVIFYRAQGHHILNHRKYYSYDHAFKKLKRFLEKEKICLQPTLINL